jgi:hypothetical protein
LNRLTNLSIDLYRSLGGADPAQAIAAPGRHFRLAQASSTLSVDR